MEDKLQREYYQDIGYRPFLFFVVFGVAGENLEVSKEKHKVDELPNGLTISTLFSEEHGEYIDGFFQGEMGTILKNTDQSLYESCKQSKKCVVLQGRVVKDSSLKYMRNVIGIIQAFFDKGAVGVLDLQTISLFSASAWKNNFFDNEINAQNHIIILCSEENGKYWLHTRGMAEFGRPDIGIKDVPEEKVHDYKQIIDQMIFYSGKGVFFERETRLHTANGKSFVIQPEFVNDFDNDDYNNAYILVRKVQECIK